MTPSEVFSLAREMPTRCRLPDYLYIIVDSVAFPTIGYEDGSIVTPLSGDIHAKLDFVCGDISQDHLRAHLRHSNCPATESSFISTFEDEGTRTYLNSY